MGSRHPETPDVLSGQSSRSLINDQGTATVSFIERLVANLEGAGIPRRSPPGVSLNAGLAGTVSLGLRSVPVPSRSDMVLTWSQSKERTLNELRSQQEREQQQQQQGPSKEEGEDARATMLVIGGVKY